MFIIRAWLKLNEGQLWENRFGLWAALTLIKLQLCVDFYKKQHVSDTGERYKRLYCGIMKCWSLPPSLASVFCPPSGSWGWIVVRKASRMIKGCARISVYVLGLLPLQPCININVGRRSFVCVYAAPTTVAPYFFLALLMTVLMQLFMI